MRPASLRDRYGRNLFGQGCLLARRLVERGVVISVFTLQAGEERVVAERVAAILRKAAGR